jgi:hypothetical protein
VAELDSHAGRGFIQSVEPAQHIAQVVLRPGAAVGKAEVAGHKGKRLGVHLLKQLLQRLRHNPDASELFQIAWHCALLGHMNQVGALRILAWRSIRTRDDIHPRIDQLVFVGDLYTGYPPLLSKPASIRKNSPLWDAASAETSVAVDSVTGASIMDAGAEREKPLSRC